MLIIIRTEVEAFGKYPVNNEVGTLVHYIMAGENTMWTLKYIIKKETQKFDSKTTTTTVESV